jgi:hypothetical protein
MAPAKTAERILDRLRRLADARGHRVALAYLPTLAEAEERALLPLAAILERYAADHPLPYIQAAARFAQLDRTQLRDSFLEANGHYTEQGSRLVAEAVAAGLGL